MSKVGGAPTGAGRPEGVERVQSRQAAEGPSEPAASEGRPQARRASQKLASAAFGGLMFQFRVEDRAPGRPSAPQRSGPPGGGVSLSGPEDAGAQAVATSSGVPGEGERLTLADPESGQYDLSVLGHLTQMDDTEATYADQDRCSANVAVAALVAGGQETLRSGVTALRDEANAVVEQLREFEDQLGGPLEETPQYQLLQTLEGIVARVDGEGPTTGDLNWLANELYEQHNQDADPGLSPDETHSLQVRLGLSSPSTQPIELVGATEVGDRTMPLDGYGDPVDDPAALRTDNVQTSSPTFRREQQRLASDVWNRLAPGQSTQVAIYDGPPGATGTGNHAILAGREADGSPYVYDPSGTPPWMTGAAAEQHLQDGVGLAYREASRLPDGTARFQCRVGLLMSPNW